MGAGLEVAVEQTGPDLAVAPLAVCYAVAVPTAVFIVLLWLIHIPVLDRHVIRPRAVLCAVGAVLLLPAVASHIGVAAVVAALAGTAVLLVVITFPAASRHH
ncbi:hypothetical protein ACFZBU_21025 [Embleya sp. NPDC008237]|uniref:hypothetical protein n=1 Tax=Embleya sp. NPDC008237 TaxID=3363978 RepID=UPI0036E2E151